MFLILLADPPSHPSRYSDRYLVARLGWYLVAMIYRNLMTHFMFLYMRNLYKLMRGSQRKSIMLLYMRNLYKLMRRSQRKESVIISFEPGMVPTLSTVLLSTLCMVGLSTLSLVLSSMCPVVLNTTLSIIIIIFLVFPLLIVLLFSLPATRDGSNQTETEIYCNIFHGGWAASANSLSFLFSLFSLF